MVKRRDFPERQTAGWQKRPRPYLQNKKGMDNRGLC